MTEQSLSAIEKAKEYGVHSVTPHLVCAGAADAIAFYKKAFGATEMIRVPAPNGKLMHACLRINGSSVMLVDEMVMPNDEGGDCGGQSPRTLKGTPVSIHLIVEDADAFVGRAIEARATVVTPVADMFWGDRFGVIEDPFGHRWSVATPGEPKSEADIQEAARRAMEEFPAAPAN